MSSAAHSPETRDHTAAALTSFVAKDSLILASTLCPLTFLLKALCPPYLPHLHCHNTYSSPTFLPKALCPACAKPPLPHSLFSRSLEFVRSIQRLCSLLSAHSTSSSSGWGYSRHDLGEKQPGMHKLALIVFVDFQLQSGSLQGVCSQVR